jgi:hypothetical protein
MSNAETRDGRAQRHYIAELRANSCIDLRYPIGSTYPARPEIGPGALAYYDRKHRGLARGERCGEFCGLHPTLPPWRASP